MTDNTEPTIDTLKANILTEFKQVLKLAPADYTENCTNVVMSLVDEYVANQVAKARIDENNMYIKELTRHHFPAGRGEPHIPLVQFHERIAELINNQIEKSEIFVPVKGCSVNRSARAILRSNT